MKHYTTMYKLYKNGEEQLFCSEKEACDFLGVSRCSVSSCCRRRTKCKGWNVERVGASTHMETKTRLHKIWEGMHERCERKKHDHYKDYGGRGISVCDDWADYVAFRDWAILNGYNDTLTIDRIDVNGDYCTENCRWVTMRKQQSNKRSNHMVYLGGVGRTITEWSEILGIGKTTIRMRLESGWTDEAALTVPVRKRTRGYRPSASCGAKMDGGAD